MCFFFFSFFLFSCDSLLKFSPTVSFPSQVSIKGMIINKFALL